MNPILLRECTYYSEYHWAIAVFAAVATVLALGAAALVVTRVRLARALAIASLAAVIPGCSLGVLFTWRGMTHASQRELDWLSTDPERQELERASSRREALYCSAGAAQLALLPGLVGGVVWGLAWRRTRRAALD